MIKFNTTKEDDDIITKIVNRAGSQNDNDVIYIDSVMDISACHCNGTPLNFQKLLDFDDFNFNHDFYGIRKHIDRNTGKLKDCFLPRCSA